MSQGAVCIIDDDNAIRDSLALLLRGRGIPCDAYASAIEFLNRGNPDWCRCLLVDQHMPDVSGLELLEILRARHITTPAIVMTGASDSRLTERAKRAGALTVLHKPIQGDELVGWIVLAGKSAPGAPLHGQ